MALSESSPLKPGKLPAGLLDSLLRGMTVGPEVLLGGAVGVDAAVIDFAPGADRYLVAKTDPITFPTDRVGHYAIHVNANDIAAMGGTPKYFLSTILLPSGKATDEMVREILTAIASACRELGCLAVGGHPEVTRGIDRPTVAGAMGGEVDAPPLIPSAGAWPGASPAGGSRSAATTARAPTCRTCSRR